MSEEFSSDHMTGDIVPAKAEVVAVVWIDTYPQQLAFDARASETASGILIVTIGKIPEKNVAMPVNKADELVAHPFISTCRASYGTCDLLVFTMHNARYQRIRPSFAWN